MSPSAVASRLTIMALFSLDSPFGSFSGTLFHPRHTLVGHAHVEAAEPPKEFVLAIPWKYRRRAQDAIGRPKGCICQISKLPRVRPPSRATENKRITPSGGGGSSGYDLGDDSRIRFTPTLAALAGLATCACLQTGHAGRTNVHTYIHTYSTDSTYSTYSLQALACVLHAAPCALIRYRLVFFFRKP